MYKRECVKLGPSRERAEDWCSSALVLQLGQCKARPFNFVLVCWFFIFFIFLFFVFLFQCSMATVGPALVHGNGALAPHE